MPLAWIALALLAAAEPTAPRLVVLTDVSSLTAGQAEPDDGQSLIRLMLYTNDFDIEGLVASSNLGHGQRTRPDLIRSVVEAYGKDHPNLLRHDPRYPPAESLAAVIRAGGSVAGPKVPVEESVGPDRDTDASRHLIAVVDRPDPRPVHVLIWGGSADLAQALWRVRQDRSPEDRERFVAKLRVHAIGDQDSTGPWIRDQFPKLNVITQQRAYRGMYRGGDPTLVDSAWVQTHIHGHGALGDLYPDYRGGDIFGRTLGPVRGIKEGDTPSFLALVPNGLTDEAHPEWGSWGGRFAGDGPQKVDIPDRDRVEPSYPDPRLTSVHRWRAEFQNDLAARLDWCIKPPADANHPPVARIAGERIHTIPTSGTVTLDASPSTDPDGDALDFAWSIYPLDPEVAGRVRIDGADTSRVRITVDDGLAGRLVPVLLTVRDRGTPRLARYARRVLAVAGPRSP
jgi:hypothetical protein